MESPDICLVFNYFFPNYCFYMKKKKKEEESTIFFLVSILMSTTKSSETKFSRDNSTISSTMLQEIKIGWDREEVKPHANNYNTSCKEKM